MSETESARMTITYLSYFVIPFFLAVHLPTSPYTDRLSTEYTFETRLKTTIFLQSQMLNATYSNFLRDFRITSDGKLNQYAGVLTIELKCRTYERNALFCHKGKHEQHPSNKQTLMSISDLYQDTIFQIRFSNTGVTDYAIETRDQETMNFMFNLYRTFGSQLSVGAKMNFHENLTFESKERSFLGLCPTSFKIQHEPIVKDRKRILAKNVLLSFNNYVPKEEEIIRVSKERHMQNCTEASGYMFGSTFWTGLFPDDAEKEIMSSQSTMTLSKYSVESRTRNIFNLNNQYMNKIGGVVEDIEVVLKSVLPTTEHERKIFLKPSLAGAIAD